MLHDRRPLLLLFGGSFNPPHAGHMRIALECAEILRPEALLFIPCASPPHKADARLLPFALRCDLLRAAIEDAAPAPRGRFVVDELEAEREGPSYTVDTLAELRRRHPEHRLAFIMGSEDFARLSDWRDWRRLPLFADLVIVPRSSGAEEGFFRDALALWPEGAAAEAPEGTAYAFALPKGGRLLFIPQPLLAISSSLVRERFLAGRSLDFLVPPGVLRLLRERRDRLSAWRPEGRVRSGLAEERA